MNGSTAKRDSDTGDTSGDGCLPRASGRSPAGGDASGRNGRRSTAGSECNDRGRRAMAPEVGGNCGVATAASRRRDSGRVPARGDALGRIMCWEDARDVTARRGSGSGASCGEGGGEELRSAGGLPVCGGTAMCTALSNFSENTNKKTLVSVHQFHCLQRCIEPRLVHQV